MESLGNKLKSARETKGYTFDQVSQETHISSRYLKALESEDFSCFPGEAFLLGFLKNYGEFLGLDVQELLSLYWAMKIQEEPVPVDKLVKRAHHFPVKLALTILAGLVLLGGVGGIVFFIISNNEQRPVQALVMQTPSEYTLTDGFIERRFYQGDVINIPSGDSFYSLQLVSLGDAVTISAPDRDVILDLGQEVGLDISNKGTEDLRITLADFAKNESSAGALLRFELDRIEVAATPSSSLATNVSMPAGNNATVTTTTTTTIFSSPSAYPFTLQATFQGYCMFRWEVLSEPARAGRTERYYQRGDELNVQAQNGIRLWASNAAAVRLQVAGGGRTVPVELGGAGEVVVAEIRWVRDDTSSYRLVLVKL